jgi:hypothetical protein
MISGPSAGEGAEFLSPIFPRSKGKVKEEDGVLDSPIGDDIKIRDMTGKSRDITLFSGNGIVS